MSAAIAALPLLWAGLITTVLISLAVIACSTICGIIGGLGLTYGPRALRWPLRLYIDIIRGIPLLVLIFIVYYGLPALGANLPAVPTAILALSLFKTAQVTEVVRAALEGIPRGQHDAGKAMGLSIPQRFFLVLLPQATRHALPPWVNLVADTVKDTTLLSLLGIVDLMLSIQQVIGRTYDAMPVYLLGIGIYFSVNYALSTLSRALEARLARAY